jgi:hypothetical protein
VNWLVSSGSSGFWLLQLCRQQRQEGLEIVRDSGRHRLELALEPVPGAETSVFGMVASTDMAISVRP